RRFVRRSQRRRAIRNPRLPTPPAELIAPPLHAQSALEGSRRSRGGGRSRNRKARPRAGLFVSPFSPSWPVGSERSGDRTGHPFLLTKTSPPLSPTGFLGRAGPPSAARGPARQGQFFCFKLPRPPQAHLPL